MVNRGAQAGQIYTGYVIDNNAENGYNPISVWIPSLNSGYVLGQWNTFGANTGSSIDKNTLAELRAICGNSSLFYRTIPVSPFAEAQYIESVGGTTPNIATWASDNRDELLNDVRKMTSDDIILSNVRYIGEGSSFMPRNSIADGRHRNYTLMTHSGIKCETLPSAPGGTYSSISVGTKVLVTFANSGKTGIVLSQIPYPDNFGEILTDTSTLPS